MESAHRRHNLRSLSATEVPTFSVIIPAYQAQDFIGHAVESLLAQDWADWETIIVFDGYEDPGVPAAETAARGDPRFKLIEQQRLGGLEAVLRGFRESCAPFICRLDADDWWEPHYLSHQARMISLHPGFDVYAHNGWVAYPDGRKEALLPGPRFDAEREIGFEELVNRNVIFAMATITRDAYLRTGGPPDRFAGDYGLWLNVMATGGRIFYSPAKIGWYRRHPGGMSNDLVALEESTLRVLESLEARDGLDPDIRHALQGSVRRRQARVERRRLEADIAVGRPTRTRARYLAARRGYDRQWLWALLLPVVLVAPSVFEKLVRGKS